jgi:hypothetical protein
MAVLGDEGAPDVLGGHVLKHVVERIARIHDIRLWLEDSRTNSSSLAGRPRSGSSARSMSRSVSTPTRTAPSFTGRWRT